LALKHVKPNEALSRELRETAREAQILIETLRGKNYLPDDFPLDQILGYSESLLELPNGSAEGCREPLVLIRNELPRIRRKYIFDQETADELEKELDNESAPPLRRGDNLDKAIRSVISAVTVALDEYREQATEAPDDELPQDRDLDNPSSVEISEAIDQSEKVETALTNIITAGKEILDLNDHVDSENYIRLANDARTASKVTRIVLTGRKIVKRWYRSLARKVATYPKLLKISGRSLRISVAVSRPIAARWNAIQGEVIDYGLEQIDLFGEMVEQIADNLENIGNTSNEIDKGEANNVATQLLRGNLPVPEYLKLHVTSLGLSNSEFFRTDLLTGLDNLVSLKMNNTMITDINQISKLKKLKTLYINGTTIESLSPAFEIELKSLIANSTHVKERRITVKNRTVTNLSLSKSKSIIAGINLTEFAKLKSLSLTHLDADLFEISSEQSSLRSLNLSGSVRDTLPDMKLFPKLKVLFLNNVKIADYSALQGLSVITSIHLNGANLTKLDSLSELSSLKKLLLNKTNIKDLRGLQKLTNLVSLHLAYNSPLDLAPLSSLKNLNYLNLVGTDHKNLDKLTVQRTKVNPNYDEEPYGEP